MPPVVEDPFSGCPRRERTARSSNARASRTRRCSYAAFMLI